MKFLFNSLLLVTWLTFQMCYIEEEDDYDLDDLFHIIRHLDVDLDHLNDPEELLVSPNITVWQQVEDRGHFIVMCEPLSHHWSSSCKLSIESENNYTRKRMFNSPHEMYYKVTVSPPVSFTCVQNTDFGGNTTKLHSDTYIFNQSGYPISVSDHHKEEVSSYYIGFASFIAVGLIIMTVVVIVTTYKSNSKESTTTATDNYYEDA